MSRFKFWLNIVLGFALHCLALHGSCVAMAESSDSHRNLDQNLSGPSAIGSQPSSTAFSQGHTRSFVEWIAAYLAVKEQLALLLQGDNSKSEVGSHIPVPPEVNKGNMLANMGVMFPPMMGKALSSDLLIALAKLKKLNRDYEIIGATDLSLKLIEYALVAAGRRSFFEAAQAVQQALELSPESAQVFFSALQLAPVTGYGGVWELLFKGITRSANEPASFIYTTLLFLIVAAVAFLVAVLIVCVVQLLVNIASINWSFSLALPLNMRGVVSPILLFLVIILPLSCGWVVTLLVWSLILALLVRHRARFHLAVMSLALLLVPLLSSMLYTSRLPWNTMVQLDRLNNGEMVVDAEATIERLQDLGRLEHVKKAVLAQVMLRQRRFHEAAEVLEAELLSPLALPELRTVNMVNMGVALLALGQPEKAKNLLLEAERLGERSFEFLVNLGLAHLASVEMEDHRRYFQQARQTDSERFDRIQFQLEGGQGWLVKPVPANMLFWGVLRLAIGVDLIRGAIGDLGNDEFLLARALSPFSSLKYVIFLTSLQLIGFSLYLLLFRGATASVALQSRTIVSRFWLVVPAGYQVAGSRPVQGLFFLGGMLTFVGAAFGFAHVGLTSFFYGTGAISQLFWGTSLTSYLLVVLVSVWQWRSDMANEQGGNY